MSAAPHDPARVLELKMLQEDVRDAANRGVPLSNSASSAVWAALGAYADALPKLERLARLERAWAEVIETAPWVRTHVVLLPIADALAAQEKGRPWLTSDA